MKKTNRFLTILMFIFLYIPMAVLVVASFNTGKDITRTAMGMYRKMNIRMVRNRFVFFMR